MSRNLKIRTSILLLIVFFMVSFSSQGHSADAQGVTSSKIRNYSSIYDGANSANLAVMVPKESASENKTITTSKGETSSLLTYRNPDFGIMMQYPSNWIKQENNLGLHTIAAFLLIHQDVYDFTNTTLAEVDLRIYNAPQNETYAKLNLGQINTQDQTIISYYKNGTTILGGFPALKIINYFFGGSTEKEMQLWTFIPGKHILVELIYIAQPSSYSRYLPIVQKMIDSVDIAH